MNVLRSFGGRSPPSCAPACSCLTPLRRLAFHCENGDCRQFLSNRSISISCDLATSTHSAKWTIEMKGYENLSASQIPWDVLRTGQIPTKSACRSREHWQEAAYNRQWQARHIRSRIRSTALSLHKFVLLSSSSSWESMILSFSASARISFFTSPSILSPQATVASYCLTPC